MRAHYAVYRSPDLPTDPPELLGLFPSYRSAEYAARRAVAGSRGASHGCIPACALEALDGFADRDGAEDATCTYIVRVALAELTDDSTHESRTS